MFTLNIYRAEAETITLTIDDFNISKFVTDPSNEENGRFVARIYNIDNPVDLFYITDLKDVVKIEVIRNDIVILASTNFIAPKEVRGYFEMANDALAAEIHFEAVVE